MVAPRFERVAFDTIVGKNKRKARSSRLTCGEQANYPPGAPSAFASATGGLCPPGAFCWNQYEKIYSVIFSDFNDRV